MSDTPVEIIQRRGALVRGLVADRSADTSVAERGLRRMGVLLDAVGNPQLSYRTIHVAGSKGKGTTTHIAAALLTALGRRTGRYVSPHLLSWNERIAVNDRAIADADFGRILADVDHVMVRIEVDRPELGTFNAFELLTAAAFVYFRKQRCDVAVVEVGLGGRFDSTNHLEPSATVITRIEAEHIDILGPTLRDVAWNKAGIIKHGVPAVTVTQRPEVRAVIEAEAQSQGTPLLREGQEWSVTAGSDGITFRSDELSQLTFRSALPGEHNLGNIGAALIAVQLATGNRPLPEAIISETLSAIRIPGRFDRRVDPITGRILILDGAHTPESIHALVETSVSESGSERVPIILGVLADKPATALLTVLARIAGRIFCAEQRSPRAIPASELCATARDLGLEAVTAPSIRAALDAIGPGPEPVLVTGSFGVVGDAMNTVTVRARFSA